MRIFWLPFIVLILFNAVIDWVIYRNLKRRCIRFLTRGHLCLSVVMPLLVVAIVVLSVAGGNDNSTFVAVMWLIYTYFTVYISKYVGVIVWLFSHLSRNRLKLRKSLEIIGVAASVLTLLFMLWGAFVTPYTYTVEQVSVESPRLPVEFDGYRIVHFSDAHLGTYNGDTTFVSRYVEAINDLNADAICFTGDLVSRITSEAYPYRNILARLQAKDGVFSVLGNHDYDDYARLSDAERDADRKALRDLETLAGWKLLNDATVIVRRDSSSIAIIGTENYGEPPFPQYGDLHRAYPTLTDDRYKILLQHNPQSWRSEVVEKTNIDLMLAGHTHAMQMMINVFGYKWSPSKWIYPEWGGKYAAGNQVLYVNIGLGMVGFPARLGAATPEITVITLHTSARQ